MKAVTAIAHANIALIKYWGKQPGKGNFPATGSLGLNLDCFFTQTTLQESSQPRFILNQKEQVGDRLERVKHFIQQISLTPCEVISENHVPTHSGLASSASGFAALAIAANAFFNLNLDQRALSELARTGSGSAARSIFPGLSRMHRSGYAEPINCPLDLNFLIISCSAQEKKIDSRSAMKQTALTSVYYSAWVQSHSEDLEASLKAVQNSDFEQLGELTEYSTLKMHACLFASKPAIDYLEPLSWKLIQEVRNLRHRGFQAYFTMDAGPHVKILCLSKDTLLIRKELEKIFGPLEIQHAKSGPGAHLL